MPDDHDPERLRAASRHALTDSLMAMPAEQRNAVVGMVRYAQYANLTIEDLAAAVDGLVAIGGAVGTAAEYADHIDRVMKQFKRGMRDAKVDLRRRQIRSVPRKKPPEGE